jgi:hypothetical protein
VLKKTNEFTTQLERGLKESFQKSLQWTMVSKNRECYCWQITWSHEVGCTDPTKDYVTLHSETIPSQCKYYLVITINRQKMNKWETTSQVSTFIEHPTIFHPVSFQIGRL